MISHNLAEEEKRTPLTAKERKALQRDRDRAKLLGTYHQTALERAKEILSKQDDPTLESLQKDEEVQGKLTTEDLKHLTKFLVNLRYRRRIEKEKETSREELEQSITDKGRGFVSQKAYDLQQELLMPMSREDRSRLIADKIKSNLYLFLEYMERY